MDSHKASNAEVAEAWIDYTNRVRPVDGQHIARDEDPAWWAIDAVMDLELSDPMRALEIAFAIARKSSDEWVLENLGAGPLETLLYRDPTFFDAVRIEAASSINLLEALKSVWTSSMPAETQVGVKRLIDR